MDSPCDAFISEYDAAPDSFSQLSINDGIDDINMYDETLFPTSYAFDLSHTPTSSPYLESQMKVTEQKIIAALSHFDNIYKMVEKYFWREQLQRRQKRLQEEFSHLQVIKEGLRTMKSDYLQLHSDQDHLFDLTQIYSEALRKKEAEVDVCTYDLTNAKDTVEATLVVFHEAENQIAKLSQKLDLTCSNSAQHSDMTIEEVVRGDSVRVDQVKPNSSTSSQWIVLYDEPLAEVELMHCDYIVMSAHHFLFDPHVEDLMSRKCGLTHKSHNSKCLNQVVMGDYLQGYQLVFYYNDVYSSGLLTSMSQGCHADTGVQVDYGVNCHQLDHLQSQHIHRDLTQVGCSYEVADPLSGLYLLMDDGCESCFLLDPSIDRVSSIAWLGFTNGLHQSWHGEDENLDSWRDVCPYIVDGGET